MSVNSRRSFSATNPLQNRLQMRLRNQLNVDILSTFTKLTYRVNSSQRQNRTT